MTGYRAGVSPPQLTRARSAADGGARTGSDAEPGTEPGTGYEPGTGCTAFGERLPRARQFARLLSGPGVERGLIGPREAERLWSRHLFNCAFLTELIPWGATVADIGSGAGLPGVVLAIARPDLEIVLVESRLRPATFLSECVEQLGLPSVTVWRGRAEDATGSVEASVTTARAVADLPRLARWARPLLAARGELLAVKGRSAESELSGVWPRLPRLGYRHGEIVLAGRDTPEGPTTVVRLVADDRAGP